jgi:hypothetical protein
VSASLRLSDNDDLVRQVRVDDSEPELHTVHRDLHKSDTCALMHRVINSVSGQVHESKANFNGQSWSDFVGPATE